MLATLHRDSKPVYIGYDVPMRRSRMSIPTLQVVQALLADPSGQHYGLQLCKLTGLPSGTVYPILSRLEKIGWIASSWEDIDPAEYGRPRRRLYGLTKDGAENARHEIAAVRQTLQPRAPLSGMTRPLGGVTQ
jgi:hypothetical protein